MFKRTESTDNPGIRCSFCRKSQDDVRKLIAGPSVHICDECVDICAGIMRDEGRFTAPPAVHDGALAKDAPQVGLTGPAVRCALCRMPTAVEDGLLIPNRGVLCPGCIGEIEATVAEWRR
jgi:hypothetical protein